MKTKTSFLLVCFLCGSLLAAGYNWQQNASEAQESLPQLKAEPKGDPIVIYRDISTEPTREKYLCFSEKNDLSEAIHNWKPGEALPAMLVNFPHYKGVHHCGIGAQGQSVEDYIYGIENEELLKKLILEPRTDDSAFKAALRELLRTRSLKDSEALLTGLRNSQPGLVGRTAFATALKEFQSPCIHLQIARFDKDRPVALAKAREVLQCMQNQLQAGDGWKASYGKASEAMIDMEHHKAGEEFHGPTHLSYAYEGFVSPEYRDIVYGFDMKTSRYASIPAGHLEVIFKEKGGTYIIETDTAIWLYFADQYFAGSKP